MEDTARAIQNLKNKEGEVEMTNAVAVNSAENSILGAYAEMARETIQNEKQYKQYGKYRVKETFVGTSSLTEVLNEYIERKASLKY